MSAPMRLLRSRLLPPRPLSLASRYAGRSPQLRRYTSEGDGAKDGPAPEKLARSTKTSSKKKATEAEAAAAAAAAAAAEATSTAARHNRRLRPARRLPATFRNLVNTDIPILAAPAILQERILRAENNTVTFDSLPYPYSPLTRNELISLCAPLLNANFSLDERFPSFSSRIINIVSPFKGSDILLEYLATALAHHTNADFLRITSTDLFQRPPSYLSHTSRVIDHSDTNGRTLPRDAAFVGSPQNVILSAIRRVERQQGAMPRGIIIGMNQRDDDDSPKLGDIPFPWRRNYGQGWSRRDAPFHLTAPIGSQSPNGTSKDDPLTVMAEIFDEFFHTTSEFTERPKIIYYADLMELLNLNDARENVLHALASSLPYTRHPILVIAPSTTTLPTHHSAPSNSQPDPLRMGGIIRIAAPFGEEDEDQDDQDTESSSAAELSYAHSPAGGYIGVSAVHLLPPTTSEARRVLQPLLDRDRRRVIEDANLRELAIVCEANSVALGPGLRDVLADRSLGRYDRVEGLIAATPARLLGDRLLTPFEIERLVVVAATERGATENPVGKSASGTKIDAHELAVETWEIDTAGLARACDIVIRSVMLREAVMANVMAVAGEEGGIPQKLSGREQKMLKQCLVGAGLPTRFDDIGGMSKTKETVRELISLPLQRPDLFRTGVLRQSTTGLLLFGPPGTGKTLLAKAISAESGSNFLAVDVSQLQSKWVGESEKNVKALFTLARKIRPCVIFVDEIDAILRGRGQATPYWAVGQIDEFMQEWDGMNAEENKGVIVIGATNRPFDLDEAVLRRMPRRILVDLPDEQTRLEILRILLRGEQLTPELDESGLRKIATQTHMYSGSDLKNLAIAAAYNAIREQDRGPEGPTRVLETAHFLQGMSEVHASLANEMGIVKQLRDWDRVFGTQEDTRGFGFV